MTGAAYWCREFKIHPDHQDDSEDSRKPCIDCKHSLFDRSTCDASGVDISKGRTEDGKPYCNIFQPVTCAECKAGGAWTNECLVSGHPITSNSPACSDFVRYDALESENQDDSDIRGKFKSESYAVKYIACGNCARWKMAPESSEWGSCAYSLTMVKNTQVACKDFKNQDDSDMKA
jgi:hypothetical protein